MPLIQATTETLRERLVRFLAEGRARRLREAKNAPKPPTDKELRIADAKAIRADIRAVDKRIGEIDRQLKGVDPDARPTYFQQEIRHERRNLRMLRQEFENEVEAPIDRDRDGQPLRPDQRQYRSGRARQIRNSAWQAAERAAAEGDHRHARRCRLDAIRARHLAEDELGWRRVRSNYV